MTSLAIERSSLGLVQPRMQAVTRTHGKSFYLASHVLSGSQRRDAYTLYTFLRRFDDAVDEPAALSAREAIAQGRAFARALSRAHNGASVISEALLPADEAAAMAELV